MKANHFHAADVLRVMVRVGQTDLFYESLEGMEGEKATELLHRSRNAEALGFVRVTDEGVFVLTAKGRDYLLATTGVL
jgi:hypothetical protein